jgi:hypothetical protein
MKMENTHSWTGITDIQSNSLKKKSIANIQAVLKQEMEPTNISYFETNISKENGNVAKRIKIYSLDMVSI